MRRMILVLSILLLFVSSNLMGKDNNGQYAIKGVGNVSCQQFNQLLQNPNEPQRYLFIGWLNGYITANNYHLPDTFDLVAWENSETLTSYLVAHCQKYPSISFFQATTQLTAQLFETRIDKLMSADGNLDKTLSMQLYYQVRVMLQQRLKNQGYYHGTVDGDIDAETVAALVAYKRTKGLPETKSVDQKTIFSLIRN